MRKVARIEAVSTTEDVEQVEKGVSVVVVDLHLITADIFDRPGAVGRSTQLHI